MGSTDGTRLGDECAASVVRDAPPPRFSIFYADGSVVGDDGKDVDVVFRVPRAWLKAPRDGVQFVVCHRGDGRLQVLGNHDIYHVDPSGEPMATNDLGALMRWVGIAKYGLWIPDAEFFAVREQVREYRRAHEEKAKK